MVLISVTLLLVLFGMPQLIQGADSKQWPPKYDFWDDSLYDNLYKSTYKGFTRIVLQNQTADQCVSSCLEDETCATLFYHIKRQECEKLPMNLEVNDVSLDTSIRNYSDNRYYRYLPPESTDFCPIEECFHYDRIAKTCWKVLYRKGPRDGTYNQEDAERACQREGGHLATINTQVKLQQVDLVLRNIPDIAPTGKEWHWIRIGAKRRGGAKSPYTWQSGQLVKRDHLSWIRRFDRLYTASPKDCVVLGRYFRSILSEEKYSFRFNPSFCSSRIPGALCEIPVPAELAKETHVLEFEPDPMWENRKKRYFSGSPQPEYRYQRDLLQCAWECKRTAFTCITFFHSFTYNFCLLVPFILVVNGHNSKDTSIVSESRTNYYRYITDSCPKDKGFFYDFKNKMCLKVFFGNGPRSGKRYERNDTGPCQAAGGRHISLDTFQKYKAVDFMLKNIPELAPRAATSWRWIWTGAMKVNGVFRWPNNQTVDISNKDMWLPFQDFNSTDNCLAFVHYRPQRQRRPIEYRFAVRRCEWFLYGYVCEIPEQQAA